jgi:hypothetical protein
MLWHGDKSMLHLEADVVDRRTVRSGDIAGYRRVTVPFDAHLLMIGAGTANGVTELPGGSSPFHLHRRRLALVERPHMHTAMALVPLDEEPPQIGSWVDVQRPLTMTTVDRIEWA